MKLIEYRTIDGTIYLESGLHIGGTNERIEIGGVDNPVIRNPINDQPYIPGSSLKGKIRSLLEWYGQNGEPKIDPRGKVHACNDLECHICRIFGSTEESNDRGPSRAIFRDAFLDSESLSELAKKLNERKGLLYAEVKSENVIN